MGKKHICMSLLIIVIISFSISFFMSSTRASFKVFTIRLWGGDRFETASAISREGWENSQYVILTTGEGMDTFADALSGTPLSVLFNAPILLTNTDYLNDEALKEINRLGASRIYLLGGQGVVSNNIRLKLEQMGKNVIRLWGENRYETAVKVAAELRRHKPFRNVILTTGSEFQYALMAAPFAARNGIPILFTENNSLNALTKRMLGEWDIKDVEIIGNDSIVSEDVADELRGMGITVSRVSGDSIQKTNINVVKRYNPDTKSLALTRDDLHYDGIAGGPFAAKNNISIFLVGNDIISDDIAQYIDGLSININYIFGGTGAISEAVAEALIITNDMLLEMGQNTLNGNTPGNIVNGGIAAVQDQWIYFSHMSDGGKLYKSRLSGNNLIKLTDNGAMGINVSGDWIYYANTGDGNKMYRINTDGSGNQKVCDDWPRYLNLVGDWIYYSNYNDDNSIYRIMADGTQKSLVYNDDAHFLNVAGGYIYYSNYNDGNKIYKVKIDGTGRQKICDDSSCYINVVNNWVYYSNNDHDNKIYRIRTNGGSKMKVNNDTSYYMNTSGDFIYYVNGNKDSSVYRISIDGRSKKNLNSTPSSSVNIAGDWAYYFNEDTMELNKMKLDGTKKQSVFYRLIAPLIIKQ